MVDAYDSPFFITNDRADIDQEAIEDGTANVWPLSDDAQLRRSPERQYCGNYATYGDKGAAIYVHNATTHALIAAGPNQHRDMTSNWPLVKTKTKAKARAARQLLDVQDQDIRITTRLVNIPSTRVTLAKQGMRLQVKGTHWGPDLDTWHYARIVSAQPQPHSDGSLYDIDLELVTSVDAVSDGPPPPDYTGDVFAGYQRSDSYPSFDGYVGYHTTYDAPEAGWPGQAKTGPIDFDQVGQPYSSMTVSQGMTVRILVRAEVVEVIPGGRTGLASLNVYVNGTLVGQDTASLPAGFNSPQLTVDLGDYHLDAGDVVSVDSLGSLDGNSPGQPTLFWTSGLTNGTWLVIVRGDYSFVHPMFVGP